MVYALPTVTAIGRNCVAFSVDFIDGPVTNVVRKSTIIITRIREKKKTQTPIFEMSVTNEDRRDYSADLEMALTAANRKCLEIAEKIFDAD